MHKFGQNQLKKLANEETKKNRTISVRFSPGMSDDSNDITPYFKLLRGLGSKLALMIVKFSISNTPVFI